MRYGILRGWEGRELAYEVFRLTPAHGNRSGVVWRGADNLWRWKDNSGIQGTYAHYTRRAAASALLEATR